MRVVCVIPARGGSVRVPKKNIKLLNGEPLITYTIKQAFASGVFDKVVVSTDDREIALISAFENAELMHRPKHLTGDCESELVIIDTIEQLEESGYKPDIVVMLQCTSPLRKPETIKKCVFKLLDNWKNCDSVITVNDVQGHHPEWMGQIFNKDDFVPYTTTWKKPQPSYARYIKLVSSMNLPKLYSQNGCVYVSKRDLIINEGLIIGTKCKAVIIDEVEAFDIDTKLDFIIAEHLIKEYR